MADFVKSGPAATQSRPMPPSDFRYFPYYDAIHAPVPDADVFSQRKQRGGKIQRAKLPLLLANVFAPWAVFVAVYALVSFQIHYHFPAVTGTLQILAFAPAVGMMLLAVNALRQGNEKWWYMFGVLAFGGAVIGASVLGGMNFTNNMKPFYDIQHFETYPSVNPARDKGAKMMDAGAVYFAEGTGIDMKRAMGFKSQDVYCVAPIVYGDKKMASYDFWAIGKNCCSGVSSDFRCGAYNDPHASAGLRLFHDSERAFYRLAVQQAEAAYGVKATHPVFFSWVADPVAEANSWREAGFFMFFSGCLGWLGFSVFCVGMSAVLYVVTKNLR